MRKIAIHQPNFCPWFPFFYKMAMVDVFVILKNVQFEKNGFQNRYQVNGSWVTKPVKSGIELILNKRYVDGSRLIDVNMQWIEAIKNTLGIQTRIAYDFHAKSVGTERLIEIIKANGGDVYVTNPDAKDKYLDEDLMRANGIDIEYCKVPKHLKIHTFEAFEKWGIEGTINQLPRVKEYSALSHIR